MAQHTVTGLSIAVIQDAEITWSEGFGVKSVARGDPVFAYAALKLCETGTLDLDTSLAACLPELYIADEPALAQITARHVLSHNTGFPNWRSDTRSLKCCFPPGARSPIQARDLSTCKK